MSKSHIAARFVKWGAVPAAVALAGGLIWQSSYSAFSATTTNPGNSWAAGTVELTDDDSGAARFDVTGMTPGQTASKCIAVTSTGSSPATVKLYSANEVKTKALDTQIQLAITQGTGGSFGDCTGFAPDATGSDVFDGTLAGFGELETYSSGVGSWATAGDTDGETKTYKITYTFDGSADNAYQGGTAGVDFVWEAQNS